MALAEGWRRAGRLGAGAALVVVALFLGIVGALQMDAVGTRAARFLVSRAAPVGWTVELERASGSWLRSLTLAGIRVSAPETGVELHLDSLLLRYRLLSFRPDRVRLESARAVGPDVRVSLVERDREVEAPAQDTSSFTFELGSLAVAGAAVRVSSAEGDSEFLLDGLDFAARELRTGTDPEVESWELETGFQPGGVEPGWGRISAAGALSPQALTMDTLSLESPRSRVQGHLRLLLDEPWARPGALSWELIAAPLTLSDLQGLAAVPGVLEGDSLFLETRTVEVGDSSRVELALRTNHGARVAGSLQWGSEADTVGGHFDLEASEIDVGRYLDPSPMAEPVELRTRGRFGDLSLEGVPESGWAEATVAASAGPEVLRGDVRAARFVDRSSGAQDSVSLRLDTLSWRSLVLRPSSAMLIRQGEALQWTAAVRPAGRGSLDGRGRVLGWAGPEPLRYDGAVRMEDLAPAGVDAHLRGGLAFEGTGSDPWSARVSLDGRLGGSTVAGVAVDTAVVELGWDQGVVALTGFGGSDRGGGRLRASALVSESGGRLRLESLRVDSLIPLFAAESGFTAHVAGVLDGEARWSGPIGEVRPEALTGRLAFRSQDSRYGTFRPDSATAEVRWRGGRFDGEVMAARGGAGEVWAAVEGEILGAQSLRIVDGGFREVDLAAFLPEAPATSLTGTLMGIWERADTGAAPSASGRLTLESSALLGDSLQGATADLHLDLDSVWVQLDAVVARGQVHGYAAADSDPERRRPRGFVEVDLPALGGFLGQPDTAVALTGRASIQSGPDTDTQDLRMDLSSARGWGARLDTLTARGRLAPEGLRLDTLEARADVLTLQGGGWLPRFLLTPGDSDLPVDGPGGPTRSFRLHAVLPDSVVPLAVGGDSVVARSGEARMEMTCDHTECRLASDVSILALRRGDLLAAATELTLEGGLGPGRRLTALESRGRIQGIRTRTAQIRDVRLAARLADADLSMEISSDIDDLREARFALDADLGPEGRSVTLQDVFFRMDTDRWRLGHPARVRWQSGDLYLDSLVLRAGDQRVDARGRWSSENGHDFRVRLDSVRVGTLSDLLGAPGLDGWLSGRVDGSGQGAVPRLAAQAQGAFTVRDRATYGVRLDAELADTVLTLDAALADSLGTTRMAARGSVPLANNAEGAWRMEIEADSLPLSWFEPYVPSEAVRGIRGSARARVSLRGTGRDPTAAGSIGLDGGRFTLPALGITLDRVRGRASLQGRTLTLDSVAFRSGGEATARGTIALPALTEPLEVALDVRARDFLTINTRLVRSVVNADMAVAGTSVSPEVAGSIEVQEATIRLDEGMAGGDVEEVTLSDEDWETLQLRYGIVRPADGPPRPPLLRETRLDLAVVLGRDIWLRQRVNPEMAVQFTGDIEVEKARGEDMPRLRGRVEAIPERSYLEQFGRRFRLEEGTVFLQGAPEDTRVEITSVYRVPPRDGDDSQISVRLGLSGEVGRLQLTLSSEPALSNGDIVSYLATGRPAQEAFSGGQGSSVTEIGTEVVASQLTGLVEQFAMSGVGLDVVEIERDGLRSATLLAGRYVTPTLFLGFRQPVSFGQTDGTGSTAAGSSQTEAQVEWRALRWLLVNLETGGSAFRFFLEGSIGY